MRNIGLITATTKASFGQHSNIWKSIGFVSRMIICTYSYSEDTIKKIVKYINDEEYLDNNVREILKGFKDVKVISVPELNQQLNTISKNDFRALKQLQLLSKSYSILRGDNKVKQIDIDKIMYLSQYLNFDYKKL